MSNDQYVLAAPSIWPELPACDLDDRIAAVRLRARIVRVDDG